MGINASGGVRGRLRVGAGVARIEYNRIACGFSAVNFICKDKFFEALVVVATLCLYGDFPKRESPVSGRVVQGVNKVAYNGYAVSL